MTVLFIQTSDPVVYLPFFEITSQTIREYVSRHGHNYQAFLGLKRGFHPWQATFNRIPILAEILCSGYEGWACYLDADAFIYDLNFPLSEYLADKDNFAFIGAPSGITPPQWWDINIGVFLINFGHPMGRNIVREWNRHFQSITDQQLRAASVWDRDLPNDQTLLHDTLQSIGESQAAVLVDGLQPRILNWGDGAFIRQVIRAEGNNSERLNKIANAVQSVLGTSRKGDSFGQPKNLYKEFTEALYHVLLLREPDEDGLTINWTRLRGGQTSLADEMRNCISSPEFQMNFGRFVERYRSRDP